MESSVWDERYGSDEYIYGTKPNDFLRDSIAVIPAGCSVLCIADGEGRNGVFLAESGFRVVSVDQSHVALEKAKQLAKIRGVSIETVCADLSDFPIAGEAFGAIVSIFAHLPRSLRSDLYPRLVAGLYPGGCLVFECFSPHQLEMPGRGGPTGAAAEGLMSADDVRTEFCGIQFQILREVERAVEEGAYHTGLCGVTQAIGSKPA